MQRRSLPYGSPLLLAAAAACAAPQATPTVPQPDSVTIELADPDAEILWDTWGVPHIFARDEASLFYASGWSQTRAHGDLLLRLYGEARGRAAEYWGEEFADGDRWLRLNGVPARARAWLTAQPVQARSWLDAFAAGINAYATAHPDSIAESARRVLPVEATDVLAHMQRVLFFEFIASRNGTEAMTRAWRLGQAVPQPEPAGGSNGWAIAPARSASGHALLLANPHLPWNGPFTWFEMQLVGAGLNVTGAALVGFPLPGIAFNDRLGWTHTVNTIDAMDIFELVPAAGGYQWDGSPRAFDAHEETLWIRRPDGTRFEERMLVRASLHGPVIAERPDGRKLALRVAGLDRSQLITQTWSMLAASNVREFEAALGMMQLPLFSVIYADADGHILHHSGGAVPIRPRGAWRDWTGVVPGDASSWLWTRTHPYRELPRLLDPGSGYVQNANEPPWTTTLPIVLRPDNYPAYMAPPPRMSFRAQQSARMLHEDLSISFEEMIGYKHSTRVALADHFLEDAILAIRADGNGIARRAAGVLERWDRTTNAESAGGILFQAFWRELQAASGGDPFEVAWQPQSPLGTPDGLKNPSLAVIALTTAAAEVEARYGTLDVPWGNVNRLRLHDIDLPGNGGPGSLGVFRVTDFGDGDGGARQALGGDSFVAAVEFGPEVRAMTLLAYGNATQRGSKYRGDQLRLYAGKRLRPAWRTRADIEANLAARERLGVR